MNQQYIPVHHLTELVQQLHIASLVAHVRPEQWLGIRDWLMQPRPAIQIDISAESPLGKLVIVTETADEKAIANFLDELRAQPGVLNAALVYHEYLSHQDLQDEFGQEEQDK